MQELADAVDADRGRVIVDLTQVTFMDSRGLNALALARRKAEARNGELRLVGASGMLRKVLHITGLDQIFPVHSTIEESIGSAGQHNGQAVNGTAVNNTAVPQSAPAEFRVESP